MIDHQPPDPREKLERKMSAAVHSSDYNGPPHCFPRIYGQQRQRPCCIFLATSRGSASVTGGEGSQRRQRADNIGHYLAYRSLYPGISLGFFTRRGEGKRVYGRGSLVNRPRHVFTRGGRREREIWWLSEWRGKEGRKEYWGR